MISPYPGRNTDQGRMEPEVTLIEIVMGYECDIQTILDCLDVEWDGDHDGLVDGP